MKINKDSICHLNSEEVLSSFNKLADNHWDFAGADTKEFTHGIHSYPAVMVSPISRSIIEIMKGHGNLSSLLDPFCGSGTTLVEGMLAGISLIHGNDINPLALMLSRAKTKIIDESNLTLSIDSFLKELDACMKSNKKIIETVDLYVTEDRGFDLTERKNWGEDACEILKDYLKESDEELPLPNFRNMGYWFRPRVILELSLLKSCIDQVPHEDARNFILVAFSESLRFVSNRRVSEHKLYRMSPEKVRDFNPDTLAIFKDILLSNKQKMIETACRLNSSQVTSEVYITEADSRHLKETPDDTFELIVTSPPYGDSKTTVAYGEYGRLTQQWLLPFNSESSQTINVDRLLMGGEKFRRGFSNSLDSETLREALEEIYNLNMERAGDVYSFYKDLDLSIKASTSKTKQGGFHFWVVGNRTVQGVTLETDKIIEELAPKHGLKPLLTMNRGIPNKVMPSRNSPTNVTGKVGPTMTMEHIIILRKE